jgi:hypothetical protein
MRARTAALIAGFSLIALGLWGYTDNPVIGTTDNVIFYTDSIHSMVYIICGVLFILIALLFPGISAGFLRLVGLLFLTVGIIGYFVLGSDETGKVLGFLNINGSDNYLHAALGLVILTAGLVVRPEIVYNPPSEV